MSDSSAEIRRFGSVAVIRRDERFLIIRRSLQVAAPGAYCFPGGGIEAGETEQQALVREMQEELQAVVRPQRRVWQCVTRWRVSLAWWQAELVGDGPLVPNPAEVASVHWQTTDEIVRLPGLLSSNVEFFQALARGQIELD